MEITVENEQLVKRTEIKDTPFTIIEVEGMYFGTIGNYKMTETFKTFDEAHDAITANTWNNVTNLFIVLHQIFKDKNLI